MNNTIDAAGQLTSQTTNGTVVNQTFDGDGRVTQSLSGWGFSYDAFDRMVTATRDGVSASYAYWPDGTRRSTTTQGGAAGASSQTFHYGTDGNLVNDTTTDSTTGTGSSATASYLITAGREARTLQPGTTGDRHRARRTHQPPSTSAPAPATCCGTVIPPSPPSSTPAAP